LSPGIVVIFSAQLITGGARVPADFCRKSKVLKLKPIKIGRWGGAGNKKSNALRLIQVKSLQ
jgi:hypothetical protein